MSIFKAQTDSMTATLTNMALSGMESGDLVDMVMRHGSKLLEAVVQKGGRGTRGSVLDEIGDILGEHKGECSNPECTCKRDKGD